MRAGALAKPSWLAPLRLAGRLLDGPLPPCGLPSSRSAWPSGRPSSRSSSSSAPSGRPSGPPSSPSASPSGPLFLTFRTAFRLAAFFGRLLGRLLHRLGRLGDGLFDRLLGLHHRRLHPGGQRRRRGWWGRGRRGQCGFRRPREFIHPPGALPARLKLGHRTLLWYLECGDTRRGRGDRAFRQRS